MIKLLNYDGKMSENWLLVSFSFQHLSSSNFPRGKWSTSLQSNHLQNFVKEHSQSSLYFCVFVEFNYLHLCISFKCEEKYFTFSEALPIVPLDFNYIQFFFWKNYGLVSNSNRTLLQAGKFFVWYLGSWGSNQTKNIFSFSESSCLLENLYCITVFCKFRIFYHCCIFTFKYTMKITWWTVSLKWIDLTIPHKLVMFLFRSHSEHTWTRRWRQWELRFITWIIPWRVSWSARRWPCYV